MDLDVNDLRSIVTVISLAVFLGICVWAYRRSNRERFEEAARVPFQSE